MTLRGIDISNLQGPPDAYRGAQWYQDAEFVIVQAIDPPAGYPGHGTDITAQQLRAAAADGKRVGVYVWLWDAYTGDSLRADIRSRLDLIPADVRLDIRLWLDVEDTTADDVADRRDDVLAALDEMDAWRAEHQPHLPESGVYTGQWYIDGPSYLGGWFPDGRVEWIADYGQPAGSLLNDQGRVCHQFSSTPIDSDVLADSEIIAAPEGADDMPVSQEYQDKFGADITWPGVAANLEGIISMLTDELATDEPKLAAVRAEVAKRYPHITIIRKAVQ